VKDPETAKAPPSAAPNSPEQEQQQMKESLEKARQAVKPLVKRELQAEIVPNDLLTFRLKMR